MTIKLLYIRFPNFHEGGVQRYSSNFLHLLSKYKSEKYEIIDLAKLYEPLVNDNSSSTNDHAHIISKITLAVDFSEIKIAIADVGLLEYREFYFIQELKRQYPNIITIATIHDSPKFIVNYNPIFQSAQSNNFIRAARKLYNFLYSSSYDRDFLKCIDFFQVLTITGKQLLLKKMDELIANRFSTNFINVSNHPLMDDFTSTETYLDTSRNNIRLGYLGFITYSKGIDILISAIAKIKNVKPDLLDGFVLNIAGRASTKHDKNYLDKLIKFTFDNNLSNNVFFLGYLEDSKIKDFIIDLDLLVLPYRAVDTGSASGPLMWAQTYSRPVLASNTRNFKEVVLNNINGILYDPANSEEALCTALTKYLSDSEYRNHIRAHAFKTSSLYSWINTADNFYSFLDKITASRS